MKRKNLKPFLSLAIAVCSFTGAYANDAILDSDPIDVTGYVKEAPVTDHELESVKNELRKQNNAIIINKEKSKKYKQLGRSTEKLADATEEMIEERKESQDVINKYNKKIKCLMAQNPGPECDKYVKRRRDQVSVAQAAPAVVAAPKQKESFSLMENIKVNPYLGVDMIDSQYDQLESNITAGVKVESDISERLSVGLGFTYSKIDTVDIQGSNIAGLCQFGCFGGLNGYQREISYKNLKFDLSGKYFLTKTSKFRPYVGASIAYNRSTSKFTDTGFVNQQLGGFGNLYGNEDLTTSRMSASVVGGTEIVFSKLIGLNVEVGYTRGLGDSFNTQRNAYNGANGFGAVNTDLIRLEEFDREISEANIFSINAGMLIYF